MFWFKKIVRAILNLLPVFTLSLLFINNTSALQHNYVGIPFMYYYGSDPILDSNTGKYYLSTDYDFINSTSPSRSNQYGSQFIIEFKGDSYNSMYDNLQMSVNLSKILGRYDSDTGKFNYDSTNDVKPLFTASYSTDSSHQLQRVQTSNVVNPYQTLVDPDYLSNISIDQQNTSVPFGQDSKPPFNNTATGLLTCGSFTNGAICDGLWNKAEYINSQVLPYWYSADGFYRVGNAVDSDGFHYSYSFAFSDLFKDIGYIPTFSYLQIPLHTYDDYFLNSENLYQGRELEFHGVFQFNGSFNWHDNIENNGSFFRIKYTGFKESSSSLQTKYADCTANLIPVNDGTFTYQLAFSCPITLDSNYLAISPMLEISGNNNYVWSTDSQWTFSQMFLTTDGDNTPGYSFNSSLTGGNSANIIGSDQFILNKNASSNNDIIIDGKNFSSSLVNLFGFSFINPFSPIYQMFTDNNSCANIPTIASMIHSESTEVCPWFDSTVRNITTPVLGLASMMLIFGFAVRWLGSRSGNFVEDSEAHESGSISIGKRRRK